MKLCVLELLWLNFSATKSQRHKKPQNIKHLKSNVNLNFKQSLSWHFKINQKKDDHPAMIGNGHPDYQSKDLLIPSTSKGGFRWQSLL